MPYILDLQEFIGTVMIPFAIVVAGVALATVMLVLFAAFAVNALGEE